jgi:hypothetical protein
MSADAAMGLAWYSPEAWRRLEAMPEPRIEKSYQRFVRNFEAMAREFAAQGYAAKRIPIDIDHMVAWCHRHGYEIDTKGRATYGALLLAAGGDPVALDKYPVVDKTRAVQ